MTTPPKAPQAPRGVDVYVNHKIGRIEAGFWNTPLTGASILTIDNTGQRVTVTRIAMTGIFAWALKKKTGDLSMVVAGANGDSCTVSVKPKRAAEAMTWAATFNAWSQAVS
jgi:hypothetical protein